MAEDRRTTVVPLLETPRTVMRPHRLEDFENIAQMWAEPEVVRHISGKPSTRQESWARLLRYIGHWCALGFGYWAVEDRRTGRFLGEVGFADFRRDIRPSLDGMTEAGWVFKQEAHGRGLATETVSAALGWADVHLDFDQTACLVAPANPASIRVAEKAGYREAARTVCQGSPALILHRPRQFRGR